ncbi:hypothetical protein QVD17_38255 [Tagetes erecta]|uniref:Uncharacterized protein n=1 Tax=Tagetes erecta TaxID=13708 RepID=A0AAD8JVF9_TARER|nr:hypothetical protein QVD17_38255 [Tagetes erecta]
MSSATVKSEMLPKPESRQIRISVPSAKQASHPSKAQKKKHSPLSIISQVCKRLENKQVKISSPIQQSKTKIRQPPTTQHKKSQASQEVASSSKKAHPQLLHTGQSSIKSHSRLASSVERMIMCSRNAPKDMLRTVKANRCLTLMKKERPGLRWPGFPFLTNLLMSAGTFQEDCFRYLLQVMADHQLSKAPDQRTCFSKFVEDTELGSLLLHLLKHSRKDC